MASVLREQCLEQVGDDESVVFLEPESCDMAILGVAREFGRPPRIAYSVSRLLAVFRSDGMDHEEAREYFEFNTAGAYLGEHTPVFVEDGDGDGPTA